MFRYLNTSGNGRLLSDEFLNIYDATVLTWEPQYSNVPWYHMAWPPLQILCQGAHAAINWAYFETLVCKLHILFFTNLTLLNLLICNMIVIDI